MNHTQGHKQFGGCCGLVHCPAIKQGFWRQCAHCQVGGLDEVDGEHALVVGTNLAAVMREVQRNPTP